MLETESSMFLGKIAADRLHGKQQSWKPAIPARSETTGFTVPGSGCP
jgi:hypothetical protein